MMTLRRPNAVGLQIKRHALNETKSLLLQFVREKYKCENWDQDIFSNCYNEINDPMCWTELCYTQVFVLTFTGNKYLRIVEMAQISK